MCEKSILNYLYFQVLLSGQPDSVTYNTPERAHRSGDIVSASQLKPRHEPGCVTVLL